MKLVYSFWTPPLYERWNKLKGDHEFEDMLQSSLNCLLLSVLYAKKWGFRVEMVCDANSYDYVKQMPFDKISTELTLLKYTGGSWVEGKIMAMMIQKEPFIHIDWDVMLLKPNVAQTLTNFKEDVIVQSIDEGEEFKGNYPDFYTFTWLIDLSNHFVQDFHSVNYKAYNCGIVGFNNLKLRDEYVQDFLKCLDVSNKRKWFDTSLIIEQYLLYVVCKREKANVKVLLKKLHSKEAEKIGYTHLIFLSKYTKKIQTKIKKRIKNEFPEYSHLIEEKPAIDNPIKISLCTVVMNRKEHLVETLKHNIKVVQEFNGSVDLNVLDYNSTDGLESYLFSQKWFLEAIEKGVLHYYKNETAKHYHRTLPKNKIHFLSKGEYLINIDADNFVSKSFLSYCLNHVNQTKNFFLRPAIESNGGAFGRIMVSRKDFKEIGGYNLKMETYGYEDTELTLRLRALGIDQIIMPAHICLDAIEHEDELRTINEKKINAKGFKNEKWASEYKNKSYGFELYPNKGMDNTIELYKLDYKKEKIKL